MLALVTLTFLHCIDVVDLVSKLLLMSEQNKLIQVSAFVLNRLNDEEELDTNKAMPGGGQVQYTCPAVLRLNNMPTTKLTRNNQPYIICLAPNKLINLIKTELGLDFG